MEEGVAEHSDDKAQNQLVSQITADPDAMQELARTLFPTPLLASLEQLAKKNREKNREKQGEPLGRMLEN